MHWRKKDNVELKFRNEEFEGYHVASIHNHPSDVMSPPSGENFGILFREFEDYELVVGGNNLWILKAYGENKDLARDLNNYSQFIFTYLDIGAEELYNNEELKNRFIELYYGDYLLNYINDKNLNDIQLTKKRYKND